MDHSVPRPPPADDKANRTWQPTHPPISTRSSKPCATATSPRLRLPRAGRFPPWGGRLAWPLLADQCHDSACLASGMGSKGVEVNRRRRLFAPEIRPSGRGGLPPALPRNDRPCRPGGADHFDHRRALRGGRECELQDDARHTALHTAATWSSVAVVRHLLKLGADPSAYDAEYTPRLPEYYAKFHKRWDVHEVWWHTRGQGGLTGGQTPLEVELAP